jgi:cell division protein FtsX
VGSRDPFLYDATVYGATGATVGQIAIGTSPSAFLVWNNKLLYFFPWHIGLVDLGSGERAI